VVLVQVLRIEERMKVFGGKKVDREKKILYIEEEK
jgi:hypothetical protein